MTLHEIAKAAGVSVTTVHRVLWGKRDVSPKTIERVNKVVKKVGYPNLMNRQNGLNNGSPSEVFKTGCIGFLLVGLQVELLEVPLLVKLLSEIEMSLADCGLMMTVMQIPDAEKPHPLVSPERLDGALIFGDVPTVLLQSKLKGIHAVGLLGSAYYVDGWADWVVSDFRVRGRMALSYLQGRGHNRVAFLNPMPERPGFGEAGFSFSRAAAKEGLLVDMLLSEEPFPLRIWNSTEGESIVEGLVDKLLQIPAGQRPTGIHVANDEICVTVYKLLRERGIEPGKDMDVISTGNHQEFLSQMDPRPATMDLNMGEIARRAVEMLIYRVNNPDALLGVTVQVPPKLIPVRCQKSS